MTTLFLTPAEAIYLISTGTPCVIKANNCALMLDYNVAEPSVAVQMIQKMRRDGGFKWAVYSNGG